MAEGVEAETGQIGKTGERGPAHRVQAILLEAQAAHRVRAPAHPALVLQETGPGIRRKVCY